MIAWIASLQPVLIAVLLAWTGAAKLRGFADPAEAKKTVLSRIVGDQAPTAFRMVGAVELAIAVALVLPPGQPAGAGASALLAVGFLGYLGYGRMMAPEASCGCSSARPERVSWRSFARAGLLLLASVLSLTGLLGMLGGQPVGWWASTLAAAPAAATAAVLAELALFGALSPEYDRHWLQPLRQLKVRLTHPLANLPDLVPLLATVEQLQLSEAYRRAAPVITSDVQDSWDEGEWRIVCYGARRQDGGAATAVFAVPLGRDEPAEVRVALIDENRQEPVSAPA